MGIVRKQLSQSNNMKFLLVLAVAAYAKAEADPGFAYHVGHPLTYAHHYPLAYHHTPLVYAAAAAGCTNNEGALVPCAHGVLPTLPYFGVVPAAAPAAEAEDEAVVSVEKREATAEPEADAEADPEADPWYAYYAAHPYTYAGYGGYHYAPHAYSYAPYTYASVYSHYGLPHHYGYYGKREATAEPTADPEADPEADPWYSYYGLGYAGHPYGYGYHAYSRYLPYSYGYHGVGCRNGYGALVPCAGK